MFVVMNAMFRKNLPPTNFGRCSTSAFQDLRSPHLPDSNLIEVIYKILNVDLKVFHNGEVMDMSIDVSNQC